MSNKRIRDWYLVFTPDNPEPLYLVSGFTVGGIYRWLDDRSSYYKVRLCKLYWFVKIMCGRPVDMNDIGDPGPNEWVMESNGQRYRVVILF